MANDSTEAIYKGFGFPIARSSRGYMHMVSGTAVIKADLLQLLLTEPGEPSQRFFISEERLVEGWLRTDVNGVAWVRRDFFNGAANDFIVTQDPRGYYWVEFGDGIDGAIPPRGAVVEISYRSGGGKRGNIVPYFFNEMMNIPAVSATVPVEVANYEAGTGGSERESIDEIRRNAVLLFKTQERAVTAADYEALTERYFASAGTGGVKARAALRHAGCAANVISLYVVKSGVRGGYDYLSQSERDAVTQWLSQRCVMTDVVRVLDAEVVEFDIAVVVRTLRVYNRAMSDVEQRVRARLTAYFDTSNWAIGQAVTMSGMIKALAPVTDVAFVEARVSPVRRRALLPNGDMSVHHWEIAAARSVRVQIQYD